MPKQDNKKYIKSQPTKQDAVQSYRIDPTKQFPSMPKDNNKWRSTQNLRKLAPLMPERDDEMKDKNQPTNKAAVLN